MKVVFHLESSALEDMGPSFYMPVEGTQFLVPDEGLGNAYLVEDQP